MIEIYKDIPNYEGLYQVSNLGNVKSLERVVKGINGISYKIKGKILKNSISNTGYYVVNILKNSIQLQFQVHQLVAMAFLGHTPDGTTKIVVDHINNIKTDNRFENLQLINYRENASKDKKGGSSQFVGVSFIKSRKKWMAGIQINGKSKNLGYYSTEYEAHYAYQSVLLTLKNN